MAVTRARYDGHADWYDNWNKPHIEANGPEVPDLLHVAELGGRPAPVVLGIRAR